MQDHWLCPISFVSVCIPGAVGTGLKCNLHINVFTLRTLHQLIAMSCLAVRRCGAAARSLSWLLLRG